MSALASGRPPGANTDVRLTPGCSQQGRLQVYARFQSKTFRRSSECRGYNDGSRLHVRKKRVLTSIRYCERPICREYRLKTPTFGSASAVKLCLLTSLLKPLAMTFSDFT